jgi:tetratricopeptide (TPR) repeat protein
MKKFISAVLLALATVAFAQSGAKIVITDPAEFNAWTQASSINDPGAKAAAMEQFAATYVNSAAREQALQLAMSSYQAAGNVAKVSEVSQKLLEAYPNNVLGLFVRVYTLRGDVMRGATDAEPKAREMGVLAERGLGLLADRKREEGMSEADFNAQQTSFTAVFNGAAGHAALVTKDYEKAQKYLRVALESNPQPDANDIYQIALAYLGPRPLSDEDMLNGIWFMARLHTMVPNWDVPVKTGKYWFKKYHGSEDGWEALVEAAKASVLPPATVLAGITKYVPPSPVDQCADILKGDVTKLSYAEWIFCLTNGSPQQKDLVWGTLQGKTLPPFLGKVIESSKDKLALAVTADGFESNTAEVEVTMANGYKSAPPVGSNVQIQANAVSYKTEPSFLMTLDEGQDLTAPKVQPKAKVVPRPKAKRR